MKRLILLTLLLLPLLTFSQTQLGSDIDGEAASDQSGYSVSIESDGSHVALGPTLISLLQLEAKSYTMKNDTEQKQKIGLLAQEVQKVFPELVSEDNNGMLAVNYQALVPVLINALKELESETSSLESQMSEFEKIIPELIEQANQNKK